MIETHDHCLTAFDVRESPAKLAEAVKNYPALDKSGGTATEVGEEADSKTTMPPATDDKAAKRKANRTMKKAAEAKEAK